MKQHFQMTPKSEFLLGIHVYMYIYIYAYSSERVKHLVDFNYARLVYTDLLLSHDVTPKHKLCIIHVLYISNQRQVIIRDCRSLHINFLNLIIKIVTCTCTYVVSKLHFPVLDAYRLLVTPQQCALLVAFTVYM